MSTVAVRRLGWDMAMWAVARGPGGRLVATVTLLLASSAANGRDYWITGNTLWEACSSAKPSSDCHSYLAGVVDATLLLQRQGGARQLLCFPDGVAGAQLTDLVTQYLRAAPERRHLPAASLVHEAITRAFPCGRK